MRVLQTPIWIHRCEHYHLPLLDQGPQQKIFPGKKAGEEGGESSTVKMAGVYPNPLLLSRQPLTSEEEAYPVTLGKHVRGLYKGEKSTRPKELSAHSGALQEFPVM